MNVVYKYPVFHGYFEQRMPKGAHILTMRVQHDAVQMWALVNASNETETRKFIFVGTGHPINEDALKYIATIETHGGDLIFHLFEVDQS